MNKTRMLAILLCALLPLAGCQSRQEANSPDVLPVTPQPSPTQPVTPPPTPSATPSPTPLPPLDPTPSPTPEPIVYNLADFLPLEDLYLKYEGMPGSASQEWYVEFYSDDSVQHRVLGASGSGVQIFRCKDGALKKVYAREKIGYTHRFLGRKDNTDETLLCEPLSVGNSWTVEGGTRTITAVGKTVEVPIGTYRVIETTTTYEDGLRSIAYYAPEVGLLAQYDYRDDELVQRLEASVREKGRGFAQSIRFYFAQPGTDSVRSILREVTVHPNTSMSSRFIKQLRSVPSGSGLIALADTVTIQSISVDKNVVHVDFSAGFITSIANLSRPGERLMLTALANTFCEYYGVSQFDITIDGELYESQYRFFLPEEYVKPDFENVKRY